jgi:hypothetical protein
MRTQRGSARATADPAAGAADDRKDPAVRRRLSAPALRAFFNIARTWGLSVAEERALLGWPATSTFHKYKSGDAGVLSFDTLTRISLVLGIYKALQLLYAEPAFADRWMQMPNTNPLFAGATPMAFAADNGLDGLFQVRRLLDARRG